LALCSSHPSGQNSLRCRWASSSPPGTPLSSNSSLKVNLKDFNYFTYVIIYFFLFRSKPFNSTWWPRW
jgi:hypothetical protein